MARRTLEAAFLKFGKNGCPGCTGKKVLDEWPKDHKSGMLQIDANRLAPIIDPKLIIK
jgi:hypothetical protein